MSARFGLVGQKSSWPHLGPSGPTFCVGRKNQKNGLGCHDYISSLQQDPADILGRTDGHTGDVHDLRYWIEMD